MRTIQLYAAGSATATSVASITFPTGGRIRGVHINFQVDTVTDNAHVRIEFSKVPTNQITTNGANDPFLELGAFNNLLTSGMTAIGIPGATFIPLDVDVRAGDIIYLHATVASTANYYVTAIFSYS